MLDISQTSIQKLAITWTGNKERKEGIVIPKTTLVPVHDFAEEVLLSTFFKMFIKNEEYFFFHHDEDVSHNEVYQSCVKIFANPESLSEEAAQLTKRLYEYSTLPKMGSGEFFVAYFQDVALQGEMMPVIGIFKTIQKDSYLKVDRTSESFTLQIGEGISAEKPALAALIFGADEAEGFRVMAIDTVSKKAEASIWHLFLQTKPIEDNYFHTRHYMNLAGEFINEKASSKFGLNRAETADLLNRSALYFKENEIFDANDFTETLFETPEQQDAFKSFKKEYVAEIEADLTEQFDISQQAVRKSARIFKNSIQLDENFKIQVQGGRELIERGFDEKRGKSFYTFYFDQEE